MEKIYYILFFISLVTGCSTAPTIQTSAAETTRFVASESKTFSDKYKVGIYIGKIAYLKLEEDMGNANGSVAVPWLHQAYDSSYVNGSPAIIENISAACVNLIQTAWMGVSSVSTMKIWLERDSQAKKASCTTTYD